MRGFRTWLLFALALLATGRTAFIPDGGPEEGVPSAAPEVAANPAEEEKDAGPAAAPERRELWKLSAARVSELPDAATLERLGGRCYGVCRPHEYAVCRL